MRFYYDSEDIEKLTPPSQPAPRPVVLDHDQRVEFLRLIHDGLGRMMACSQLGIDVPTLDRTLRRSRSFRKALEHVEQVRADNLFTGLYVAALKGDTRAARFLLSRQDRAKGRRGQP